MNDPLAYYGSRLSKDQKEMILESQEYLLKKPVPIVDLAKELGVKKVVKAELDEEASGMIEERENVGFVIITNKKDPKVRRNFTIAHELAHFLLHKDQIGDGIIDNVMYRSGLSTQTEVEANRLAADILMPLEKIDEYIDREGTANVYVQDLAETFGVSASAMKVRLGIPDKRW